MARPQHLTNLYSDYGKHRSSFASELAEIVRLRSRLESWSGVSVLDIGCGFGHISRVFADLGASVTGIEYNIQGVMAATAENPTVRVIAGDAHHLPFEDRSFDYIILADVLEHVKDPRRVLAEAARVARSHAWVYIGATNRTSVANCFADPHYNVPLIPFMSKRVATWYVTKLLRVSDSFNVEMYFIRGKLLRLLRESGFECEPLRLYLGKIRRSDFVLAPGRGILRRLLSIPGIRPVMLSVADTMAFEYWIAPGFDFLCRRVSADAVEGSGALVCSGCHGVLVRREAGLTCSECGRSFEIRTGIPLMHLSAGHSR